MNINAGGQTIADRINSARFGLAGHMLAKAVCKATTEEQIGPKKKHLDYLLHCTEEPNVSIPQLANLLLDRLQHVNWIVVYKALVSIHHLMLYGNERFIQYLASANTSFSLNSFLDNKSGVQGYDMSTYIRRYSKYLNQKALSYRVVAFDFCKVKRGKDDGVLRKMSAEKLLKTLPVIQDQMDALLEFDCSPNELTNAVISSCFVLLFRDLIRLFACYNDGIINMLEKYFDMNKKSCRDALDIYKKFLVRMDKVAGFLKVAENVGIPKGEIPDLTKAPASLLDALEQHLDHLEGGKKSAGTPPGGVTASGSLHTGLMSLSATEHSLNEVDEKEKQRAILEEQQAMEEIRKRREQMAATQQSMPGSSENQFTGSSGNQFTGNFPKAPSGPTSPSNGVVPHFNGNSSNAMNASASSSKSDFDSLMELDFNPGFSGAATNSQSTSSFNSLSGLSQNDFSQNQQQRQAVPPQALFSNAYASNPFASPSGNFVQPSSMQSPAGNMSMGGNPFGMPQNNNGYQNNNMAMSFNSGQMGQKPTQSPMGQPQGGSGFDADFGSVFGGPALQSGPTKSASGMQQQSSPAQSKLIQNNVEQSLANLANNLNLGSLGAYGVRPAAAAPNPAGFTVGNAGFGNTGMGSTSQRQPMAGPPMQQQQQQQQQAQFGQANNASAAGGWNPFMTMTPTTPGQQTSPTRGVPAAAPAAMNDPFASLI